MFLAGGEIESLTRALLDCGAKYVLLSWYYIIRFRKFDLVEMIHREYPGTQVFLDSGAFTYAEKCRDPRSAGKLPDADSYVKYYFDYVREMGHNYCRIAEADLDGIDSLGVSYDQTKEWLEEMLQQFPHLNVMPTYHGWRPREDWERYCLDPRIKTMAIGRGTKDLGIQRRLVMRARKARKPVHGFAMTKIKTTLEQVPYDSVDSTSVWMGQKYGLTYIFHNRIWKVLTKDEKPLRRLYRRYFDSIGCDPQKIMADDLDEVRKANIRAWVKLAEYYQLEKVKRDKETMLGSEAMGLLTDAMVEQQRIEDQMKLIEQKVVIPGNPLAEMERAIEVQKTGPRAPYVSQRRALAGFGIPIKKG